MTDRQPQTESRPLRALREHMIDAAVEFEAKVKRQPQSVQEEEYAALEIYLRQRIEKLREGK